MSNKNSIIINSIITSIAVIAVIIITRQAIPKTGYVDITVLYEGFSYKKEMEKKFTSIQQVRQYVLDSLKVNIDLYTNSLNTKTNPSKKNIDQLNYLKQEYQYRNNQYNEELERIKNEYTSQVLQQLNQYVQDYGKAYNYTYIFGAKSDGSMMHAKKQKNITDDVLEYINKKYLGDIE